MPKQILVLDSSQISTFLECAEKWNLVNIECLTRSNTVDDAMVAGTLMHKYLEIYYTALGMGLSKELASREALAFNPDAKDETDKHQYPLGKEIRQQIVNRFIEYTMVYQSDYEVGLGQRNIIRIAENGLPFDTTEKLPLVEQGFSYELLNTSEYLFVLEGRIDFIGNISGNPIWMDHKLQFRKRQLYKKRIQFRNYSLALGYNLGIINYIRMAKEGSKDTFVREPISFSTRENQIWREELIDIYVRILRDKAEDNWIHRANRDSCDGKYGYKCQFTDVCEEYNSETREDVKARDFVKRVRWTPW